MEFATTLECLSAPTVQHYLAHNALLAEQDFINDLGCFPDNESTKICVATLTSDPRAIVGMVIFHVDERSLNFDFIRVGNNFRGAGLAKRMITYVLHHPLTMCVSLVRWTAGSDGGDALIRYLQGLQCNAKRLCGTPFKLEARRQVKTSA